MKTRSFLLTLGVLFAPLAAAAPSGDRVVFEETLSSGIRGGSVRLETDRTLGRAWIELELVDGRFPVYEGEAPTETRRIAVEGLRVDPASGLIRLGKGGAACSVAPGGSRRDAPAGEPACRISVETKDVRVDDGFRMVDRSLVVVRLSDGVPDENVAEVVR